MRTLCACLEGTGWVCFTFHPQINWPLSVRELLTATGIWTSIISPTIYFLSEESCVGLEKPLRRTKCWKCFIEDALICIVRNPANKDSLFTLAMVSNEKIVNIVSNVELTCRPPYQLDDLLVDGSSKQSALWQSNWSQFSIIILLQSCTFVFSPLA